LTSARGSHPVITLCAHSSSPARRERWEVRTC
jgi:hypothetical protein